MARTSSTSQRTNKVFENFIPIEILPAWDKRDRHRMELWKNSSEGRAVETKRLERVRSPWRSQRTERRTTKDHSDFEIFLFFFAFSRAASTAHGGSQDRGLIRAVAVSLHHSHSNAGSLTH